MFRMFLTVAMLVAFITPGTQAAVKFEDAFAEPFAGPAPDQSTPTLGTIPAQAVSICCELELDLSTFVTGTIGTLMFRASTSDAEVVTVSVSGSDSYDHSRSGRPGADHGDARRYDDYHLYGHRAGRQSLVGVGRRQRLPA